VAGGVALASTLRGARANEAPVTNADAVKGTWVIQQASSAAELEQALAGSLSRALATPGIVGFSHRVSWASIDADFALLDQGYAVAATHGLQYAPRFMAGRWTPARVFEAGCAWYPRTATNEPVPRPFEPDGSPNTRFEDEWDALVARLAGWCRERGVRLMHLAWYGQDWAELNHGAEVRALPGYTYGNWLAAHTRQLDRALAHADVTLAVELPLSGYGPLSSNSGSPAARDLAAHVVSRIGACNPRFFCQANGLGPSGDWGAPVAQTEAAFDRDVWPQAVYRGQQMIQPQDYDDWAGIFKQLYANGATYCEVYAPSFYDSAGSPQPHLAQLTEEIAGFASHVASVTPAPMGCG
jgi:hypothetical protein